MTMRMQDLVERSGLPKTTIHHYVREGLLPPAHKTAPNAAQYDDAHLERLQLITRLRAEDAGSLSIPEIRRVLELMEQGVELRGAVRLVQEDLAPEVPRWSGPTELAAAAGCSVAFIDELDEGGLLSAGADDQFTPGDLLVARACRALCDGRGVDPVDLTPLADLIREVGHYSETLVEVQDVRAAGGGTSVGSHEKAGALRRHLSELCEALLWRSFEASDDVPADSHRGL